MDANQSVLAGVYDLLTMDGALNSVMSGARVYHKAPRDAAWPYVTIRLDTISGTQSATKPGTLTVHVWDRGTSTDRAWSIRRELTRLLDLARLNADSMGIVRCWHASDAWVPDEDDQIVHLVMVFDVRYARAGEVRRIMTQKGL